MSSLKVFALYHLTEEETRIVEEATRSASCPEVQEWPSWICECTGDRRDIEHKRW